MGFRYYKRVSLGKGLNVNLSKTGVGVSAGVSGLRYSMHSSGRRTTTAGVPGTGLYYRSDKMASLGDSVRSKLEANTPHPNRLGSPDEYAMLVGHVVANPMLNGEVIRLDGALRMPPR